MADDEHFLPPSPTLPDPVVAAAPAQSMPEAVDGVVNLINPDGKLVGVPQSNLTAAINNGYTPATAEHIEAYKKEQKYSSAGQQALATLEGAAEGVTFGFSPVLEQATGLTTAEDIRGRREINPGKHNFGEVLGLAGSAFIPGVGEANVLRAAGQGAAKAIGLGAAESTLSKIGSSAVKLAVENMLFQGTTGEVGKLLTNDPSQSVQTAITDIGLSGILGGVTGGAFGAASPLWKATLGGKTGGILKTLADKAGGIEGVVPDHINDAIQVSGMDIAPEVKAALGDNPHVNQMFQTLQESSTGSGIKAQEALKSFKNQAGEALVGVLGKTPEDISSLEHVSDYEAGANLKKSLVNQLKQVVDPISEQFDKIKERFKGTELPSAAKGDIATKISEVANTEGWNLSPSSPQAKIVGRVLDELPNLKTLEDVRKYASVIGDTTSNPELWRVGSQLKKIFRATEEGVLDQTLGAEAPELVGSHAEARQAYGRAMDTIENLNDRLHVGRYSGPASFMKALGEMAPEDVLRRLSPKGDAGIIGELTGKFPEAAAQIKDYHLGQALKQSASRIAPGETINSKALFSALDKMSPEMRQFILPEGAAPKVDAIRSLIDGVPSKMNNSGTAKTLDSLWQHVPSSAIGIATLLTGHSPVAGLIIGGIAKAISRDVPDAIRLAALKFLGSGQKIESEGFKTMVDFIHHTIQGENLMTKASKNLFKAGAIVLPDSLIPKHSDRQKLDKQLKSLQKDPKPLLDTGGKTAHYLPEQGAALSTVAANATNYLNSVRPGIKQNGPLDTPQEPTEAQKTQYNRTLDIAQQPLMVLNHIKEGTILPQDIEAIKTLYPELYSRLSNKITSDMIAHTAKNEAVPYKLRMGLSLFLGQPLDSTMSPQSIIAAQMANMSTAAKQGGEQQGVTTESDTTSKKSASALNKLSQAYQTPGQASQARSVKA